MTMLPPWRFPCVLIAPLEQSKKSAIPMTARPSEYQNLSFIFFNLQRLEVDPNPSGVVGRQR